MREIWFDSDIYVLADRGLAYGKKAVLEILAEHVEQGLPIPEDLLAAAARVIRKEIPKIKNDKGVHDKDFSAWANADSVKELLDADPQLSVEDACHAVSQKTGLSFDAVSKHWKKFCSNDEFKRGEIPPLKMLGTIPFKGCSRKKKIRRSSYRDQHVACDKNLVQLTSLEAERDVENQHVRSSARTTRLQNSG